MRDRCEYGAGTPGLRDCRSTIGLTTVAYRPWRPNMADAPTIGPVTVCSTHRQTLSAAVQEWLDPAAVAATVEAEADAASELAERDERIDAGLGAGYIGEFR